MLYTKIVSRINGKYIWFCKELIEKFKGHFDEDYLFLFEMMEIVLDK